MSEERQVDIKISMDSKVLGDEEQLELSRFVVGQIECPSRPGTRDAGSFSKKSSETDGRRNRSTKLLDVSDPVLTKSMSEVSPNRAHDGVRV